jgi:hypothetical protein
MVGGTDVTSGQRYSEEVATSSKAAELTTIIPHLGADCSGCLTAVVRRGEVDVVCNECGTLLRTVSVLDLEQTLEKLAQSQEI